MSESVISSYLQAEKIEDSVIESLITDRQLEKEKMKTLTQNLKARNQELMEIITKAQLDISTLSGAINYIDGKIIARHNEITKEN